jgi:hypothetical protein
MTLRATVTRGQGATLSFVRNGAAEDSIAVTADPFTVTRDVDAPPGTRDDRWRCELAVNGPPRVITGHIWLAAAGEPSRPDAGPALDARTMDTAGSSPGSCGCHTPGARRGHATTLGALLAGLALRRRRPRGAIGAS